MFQHAKTVEAIYAAFGRGDIPGILAALREDVEWEDDAVDQGIPWLASHQCRALRWSSHPSARFRGSEIGDQSVSDSQTDPRVSVTSVTGRYRLP